VSEIPTRGRVRRLVIIVAGVIFSAIIVVSLVLALSTPISLPSTTATNQTTESGPTPYVMVEVIKAPNTTYTTTMTVTPQLFVSVAIHPEVLVIVSGNHTYTITTNVTSTFTTWR